MIIKARGTVTLPRKPRAVGECVRFCKEAAQTLQQLRDRSWVVTLPGARGTPPHPFKVTFNSDRIYVAPGSIFTAPTYFEKQKITPTMPTLGGSALDQDPAPYFSASSNGERKIWVRLTNYYTAEVIVTTPGEQPELEQDQNAILIAIVTISGGSSKRAEIEQIWSSDIPWFFDNEQTSSEESGDSDDSGSGDSGDSDDSDGSGGGDSSDESDDSSDESSSSGGCSCPEIQNLKAHIYILNESDDGIGPCFETSPQAVTIGVHADLLGICKACEGELFLGVVVYTPTGPKKTAINLGGDGHYSTTVDVNWNAGDTYTVRAYIGLPVGVSPACDLDDCTPVEIEVTAPPVC